MAGRLELLVDEQSIWTRREVRRSERWAAWAAGLGVVGGVLAAACSAAAVAGKAGPFVYVADTKRDEISQFPASRSPHGALKPLAASTVPAGPFPYTIAVDPQGTSAYATSSASKVYQYTINPATGRLTPKSPATVATRSGETAAIAFTPDGTSAYVVGNNISQYSIDATTGDLTPKSPATVGTPPNPEPIAVSPNGKYAYVATCGGCGYALQKTQFHAPAGPAAAKRQPAKPSYLVEYRINPRTGALSRKPIAKVTTGNGANWIALAPNGKSVYVATSTGVWQYTTNPTTGDLSPKDPETTGANRAQHRDRAQRQERLRHRRHQQQGLSIPHQPAHRHAQLQARIDRAHRAAPRGDRALRRWQERLRHQRKRPRDGAVHDQPHDRQDHGDDASHSQDSKRRARPGRNTHPVREVSPPQTSLRRNNTSSATARCWSLVSRANRGRWRERGDACRGIKGGLAGEDAWLGRRHRSIAAASAAGSSSAPSPGPGYRSSSSATASVGAGRVAAPEFNSGSRVVGANQIGGRCRIHADRHSRLWPRRELLLLLNLDRATLTCAGCWISRSEQCDGGAGPGWRRARWSHSVDRG